MFSVHNNLKQIAIKFFKSLTQVTDFFLSFDWITSSSSGVAPNVLRNFRIDLEHVSTDFYFPDMPA